MAKSEHEDIWHSELIAQESVSGGQTLQVKAGAKYGGHLLTVLASEDIAKGDIVRTYFHRKFDGIFYTVVGKK